MSTLNYVGAMGIGFYGDIIEPYPQSITFTAVSQLSCMLFAHGVFILSAYIFVALYANSFV